MLEEEKVICLGDINNNFMDMEAPATRYALDMMEATGVPTTNNK